MKLQAFLDAASSKPFRRGHHDCVRIAARWVLLQTDRDVLEGHTYSSLAEGKRKLREAGLRSHIDIFARALPRKSTLALSPGDIAVVPDRRAPTVGIVMPGGERIWCFGKSGAVSVPLSAARGGFAVVPR